MFFRYLHFFGMLVASMSVSAQDGVVPTGADASGVGGSVSYTIGQIDYLNATGTGGSLNQGIQQPATVGGVGAINEDKIFVSVYPNPTWDNINIQFLDETLLQDDAFYEICNLLGEVVSQGKIYASVSTLSIEDFRSGGYILKLYTENSILQTYHIIKN